MRREFLPILIPVLFGVLVGCQPTGSGSGREVQVADAVGRTPSELVSTWVEMWNSYDLDQVEELFLTDERPTYFSSEYEGVIRGFDALVEHHQGFGFVPGGEERGAHLWVEDLVEEVFGKAAVLTGIWFFEGGNEGGARVASAPQRGPVTFVCVLEEGRWRFAHMNFGKYLDQEEPEEG